MYVGSASVVRATDVHQYNTSFVLLGARQAQARDATGAGGLSPLEPHYAIWNALWNALFIALCHALCNTLFTVAGDAGGLSPLEPAALLHERTDRLAAQLFQHDMVHYTVHCIVHYTAHCTVHSMVHYIVHYKVHTWCIT